MRDRRIPMCAVVALLLIAQAPAAEAAKTPALAYTGGNDRAATATLSGTVLQRFSKVGPFVSLSGGVLAAARPGAGGTSDVLGFDAATGAELFTIDDASFPLLTRGGRAVVFLPDANGTGDSPDRDPSVNSVWYENLTTGHDRKLVAFSNADRAPLHLAASPDGRWVAVDHGNDVDVFRSDIYVARTGVHEVRRLTHDGDSWYPSFSPDSTTIAYTHRAGTDGCSGGVRLIGVDGSNPRTLTTGTCARSLLRPVWLDADTIVAWWWKRLPDLSFAPQGLVEVAVADGTVTTLVQAPVADFSVSRPLHRIAFRLESGRIRLLDLNTDTVAPVPGGTRPRGIHLFLDGALELAY